MEALPLLPPTPITGPETDALFSVWANNALGSYTRCQVGGHYSWTSSAISYGLRQIVKGQVLPVFNILLCFDHYRSDKRQHLLKVFCAKVSKSVRWRNKLYYSEPYLRLGALMMSPSITVYCQGLIRVKRKNFSEIIDISMVKHYRHYDFITTIGFMLFMINWWIFC